MKSASEKKFYEAAFRGYDTTPVSNKFKALLTQIEATSNRSCVMASY